MPTEYIRRSSIEFLEFVAELGRESVAKIAPALTKTTDTWNKND